MANELNITKEETMENTAVTFTGEDKGVMDDNKIVPIVNKGNTADSGNAVAESVPVTDPGAQTVSVTTVEAQAAVSTTVPAADQPAMSTVPTAVRPETAAQAAADYVAASSVASAENIPSNHPNASANTSDFTPPPKHNDESKSSSYADDADDDFDPDGDDRPKRRFFRFRSANEEESRDKLILSRIKDEDLMEYLALEQRRLEFLQQAKEAKEKRFLTAFQLLISLAAIVAITYLLQDNPTILISILYIVGIVAALNVWRNPRDKGRRH